MIAVIDSGVANLASVMASLQRLGAEAEITSDPVVIREAERVILPGVGSAAPAMAQLRDKQLVEVVRGLTRPVLGICLGMQLLFTRSEEGGDTSCLDIIPGEVRLLQSSAETPVPHMGWNTLALQAAEHPLLRGVADGSFVYFVHSFAAPSGPYSLALTTYGTAFTAIAQHKNFLGCQFHPERSSTAGSQILRNFLDIER
ncbi:MAG: imidazole glycerol phosphate synthase subunit HisH [Pseudomonadota bacterium]|nr:imidazole glycerol phosphate synthase subunit HisH [Pseudomonadota bacterium]